MHFARLMSTWIHNRLTLRVDLLKGYGPHPRVRDPSVRAVCFVDGVPEANKPGSAIICRHYLTIWQFMNSGYYGIHPFCRCVLLADILQALHAHFGYFERDAGSPAGHVDGRTVILLL